MSSTSNDIPSNRRRVLRWLPAGAVVIAVAVAGCGGYSATSSKQSTSGSARYGTPATQPKAAKPSSGAAASGIPQHNGGDHDADNNGGPSDGDGNI
jgi:hypothetical protein